MKGQWIGNYSGSNNGNITVELDEQPDGYVGWAYLYDSAAGYPASSAPISTNNKSSEQEFEVSVGPIDSSSRTSDWHNYKEKYPGFQFPTKATVKSKLDPKFLTLEWKTDIRTFGNAQLPRPKSTDASEVTPLNVDTWQKFKEFVATLSSRKYVFRGQARASEWRLRTHFHRTGRADLKRLIYVDIPELHRVTLNVTSHKFNLSDPDEIGAFYALVQHHGYPTPLLDWSYSPYVAAYFAYSGLNKNKLDPNGLCRIYIFDKQQWENDYGQLSYIAGAQPHFSLITPLPLGNPRMSPQQALATLTNVDDIESYIRNREQDKNKTYLQAIDLPVPSRAEVMRDLEMMGITAASLFPGIDGACRYQKERLF